MDIRAASHTVQCTPEALEGLEEETEIDLPFNNFTGHRSATSGSQICWEYWEKQFLTSRHWPGTDSQSWAFSCRMEAISQEATADQTMLPLPWTYTSQPNDHAWIQASANFFKSPKRPNTYLPTLTDTNEFAAFPAALPGSKLWSLLKFPIIELPHFLRTSEQNKTLLCETLLNHLTHHIISSFWHSFSEMPMVLHGICSLFAQWVTDPTY